MSWVGWPQALREGFSILPILEREKCNRRLCLLQHSRENTASLMTKQRFSVETEGACESNSEDIVRLQSEKRGGWIREVRGERLQGTVKAEVAHPVWPTHQPRCFSEKNE